MTVTSSSASMCIGFEFLLVRSVVCLLSKEERRKALPDCVFLVKTFVIFESDARASVKSYTKIILARN